MNENRDHCLYWQVIGIAMKILSFEQQSRSGEGKIPPIRLLAILPSNGAGVEPFELNNKLIMFELTASPAIAFLREPSCLRATLEQ